MTKKDFLKTIPGFRKITPVFSQATKMPMVFCHEETMDDYIYVYLEEADAVERAKELTAAKQPAVAVTCKDKEVLTFFGGLRLTGVNAVCFVTSKKRGAEKFLVQLTDFLKQPDFKNLPDNKRPVENPTLHLSLLYFMQEVRRPVPMEEKKGLKELEEEASVNLTRAQFLIPVQAAQTEGENKGKSAVLLLKNDKNEVFIPVFTDAIEVRRFMKGQNTPIIHTEFLNVANMIGNSKAVGLVVNAASSNVMLNQAGVNSLIQRFFTEAEEPENNAEA